MCFSSSPGGGERQFEGSGGMNDSLLREMQYWFRLPVLVPFQLVDTRIAENEGLRGSSYCERSIVPFYSS